MRRAWRAPLLAAAMLSMVWGVWLGLLRIGWALPLPWPDQLIVHGPVMIGGFLGTLIGLERAIGIAKRWAYAAPICSAAGAVLLASGRFGSGALLLTAASAIVVFVFVLVWARQPSLFAATIGIGAVSWLIGNARWLSGFAIYHVVSWWMAFVVLTIAGERLELNRVLRPSTRSRVVFIGSIIVTIAGAAAGVRVLGVGFIALASWLAVNDVARRTIRQRSLTRFIAVCLLSGYAWLGAGGVIAVVTGVAETGPVYDAVLHAVFLGFVMSMIFGHAPIVFPAVLGRPLPYRSAFYAHLLLLHVSLAIRLIGDLIDTLGRLRSWGGLLNAASLVFFIVNTGSSLASGLRNAKSSS